MAKHRKGLDTGNGLMPVSNARRQRSQDDASRKFH